MITLKQGASAALAVLLWCAGSTVGGQPTSAAAPKKPLAEMSSAEMKEAIDSGRTLAGLPDNMRALGEQFGRSLYESRQLAEQYFAATGDARKKLAGAANAGAARDVVYDIIKTPRLDVVLSRPPEGQEMDLAWFAERIRGTYEGVFLVRPSDGRPLEQYHMVFDVAEGGARKIKLVEKDPAFDPVAYAQEFEKAEITAWVAANLKGKREAVLSRLPAGDYPYLNVPEIAAGRIDRWSLSPASQPSTGSATTKSVWTGAMYLLFKPENSEYGITEKLRIVIEKEGGSISVVECRRDEEFAKTVAKKVEAADFIVNYISHPDRRAEWLVKGGSDDLPKSMTVLAGRREDLALGLEEKKRVVPGSPCMEGDPGKGVVFRTIWGVRENKEGAKSTKYIFVVVGEMDTESGFAMLGVMPAVPYEH